MERVTDGARSSDVLALEKAYAKAGQDIDVWLMQIPAGQTLELWEWEPETWGEGSVPDDVQTPVVGDDETLPLFPPEVSRVPRPRWAHPWRLVVQPRSPEGCTPPVVPATMPSVVPETPVGLVSWLLYWVRYKL